jgi:hypothetical protein
LTPIDFTLWQALEQALREPPADLPGALSTLPPVGVLPQPWITWTLIGLVRHRRRQLEVGAIVSDTLRSLPGHPRTGLVPGRTDWEFTFHGRGCCLTHRATGETIDVDFYEPTGEYIDTWFYIRYLESLRHPEPPEARLIALVPSLEPIGLSVAELIAAGALVPHEDVRHVYRVAPEVLEHEEAIAALSALWGESARRPWIAALIGDWPAAHEAALAFGDSGLAALCAGRAAACKELRWRDLLERGESDDSGDVLLALDDAGAPCMEEQLERALDRTPGGTTARALTLIERRGDAAWCPSLRRLLHRLDPRRELPEPSLWVKCLGFLLRYDPCREDPRAALLGAQGVAIAEAGLLALEHAPEHALSLFRRALRSEIPLNRIEAAAALALINRPWSRRELLAVLRDSHDAEATAECRAALQECPDAEAHSAVAAWEQGHPLPPEPEPGRPMTIRECLIGSCPERVQRQMSRMHDRVRALRDRVLDECAS